jgi:hypothetical protein
LSDIHNTCEIPSGSIIQDSFLHLQAIGIGVKSLIVCNVGSIELKDDFFAATRVSDIRDWAKFECPFSYLTFSIHTHNNSCRLVLVILIVEGDLIDEIRLPVDQALILRISSWFWGTIWRSEDVGAAILLIKIRLAKRLIISDVNKEVKIVSVVLVLESKVEPSNLIITIKSQIVKLILEKDNIITLSLNFEVGSWVIDQLNQT